MLQVTSAQNGSLRPVVSSRLWFVCETRIPRRVHVAVGTFAVKELAPALASVMSFSAEVVVRESLETVSAAHQVSSQNFKSQPPFLTRD